MNEITIKSQDGIVNYATEYIKKNNIIVSKNYDMPRAMNSLYLNLIQVKDKNNKSALETCSPESIQEAVAECINNELNVSKSQGYFIPYGNKLQFQKSYFGKKKLARDLAGVEIHAQVVHEGDQVSIEDRIDGTRVIKMKASIENLNNPVAYAFAVATDIETGRVVDSDIMTYKELYASSMQGTAGGATFKKFPVEMSKKIVTGRLAKHFINTSDDSARITITNPDDSIVNVNETADIYDFSEYTIDTDEQIESEKEKYEPAENENVAKLGDLKVSEITEPEIPEGAIRVDYKKIKENRDAYKVINGTYDANSYTIMAIPLNPED